MKSFFQTFSGIVVAALVALILGARIMLDLIGYTTAPDDFELFKQRLPRVLDWLFSTPWWVPSLLMGGLVALAAWLIVSGTRSATKDQLEDQEALSEAEIRAIINNHLTEIGEIQNEEEGSSNQILTEDRVRELVASHTRPLTDIIVLPFLEDLHKKVADFATGLSRELADLQKATVEDAKEWEHRLYEYNIGVNGTQREVAEMHLKLEKIDTKLPAHYTVPIADKISASRLIEYSSQAENTHNFIVSLQRYADTLQKDILAVRQSLVRQARMISHDRFLHD